MRGQHLSVGVLKFLDVYFVHIQKHYQATTVNISKLEWPTLLNKGYADPVYHAVVQCGITLKSSPAPLPLQWISL